MLVLSGGGAKGLAHIGVLRALDEAGVRPAMIVGTSMGSIVGALAASGYSAMQLDSLARSLPLAATFASGEPRGPLAWGALLPLVLWEEGEGGFAVQGSTVRLAGVNGLLNAELLRANLMARGDFDRLPIPLRVVATDLADRTVVVLRSGDLAQAVRASIAVPLVFPPERIGDRMLTDGGLSANIPISVARDLGAARVIVSDVTEEPSDTLNLESPFVVADRLLNWLFRQPADSLHAGDLRIRSRVGGFRSLDFSREAVDSLLALGYAAGQEALATWRCRDVLGGRPAPSPLPIPTRITRVEGEAGDPSAIRLLQRTLDLQAGDPLRPALLGVRLRELAEREIFREVWLGPIGGGDTLAFAPTLRRLPQRVTALGLAYDTELGGRLWAGALDRQLPLLHGEGSALLLLGRYRSDLLLAARRPTLLGQPAFSPVGTLQFAGEDVRRFDAEGLELAVDDMREVVASAGVERQLSEGFRVTATGEWRSWQDTDLLSRERGDGTAIGARIMVEKLTDDRRRLARLDLAATDVYALAALDVRFRGAIGPFRLEHQVRMGVGDQLPAQLTFPLGGEDGFPGLRLGERRGDRELSTALTLSRRVLGPLRLRLTGAVGRSTFARDPGTAGVTPRDPGFHVIGPLFGSEGWLLGARVGLGTDTPLGPVRVEYGWNDANRQAVFLRVGRWF
jgi:NTE family protein